MRRNVVGLVACVAVLCLFVPGCGESGPPEVSGTVTLDGKPVHEGAITFIPLDGQSPTAGAVIQNGQYTTKVPLGEMKVKISAPKVTGKKKLYPGRPDSPEMPITEEGAPEKYNTKSELLYTVVKGKNEKNWELSTK